MVIKVYISGMSGSKEVKKRQQRVTMILDSKHITYSIIDITEPGQEGEKDFMQKNSEHCGATISDQNPRHPLPPQLFNDTDYCGDYDDFDLANEIDNLEVFLKLEAPKPAATSTGEEVSEDQQQKNGTGDEQDASQVTATETAADDDEDKENKTEEGANETAVESSDTNDDDLQMNNETDEVSTVAEEINESPNIEGSESSKTNEVTSTKSTEENVPQSIEDNESATTVQKDEHERSGSFEDVPEAETTTETSDHTDDGPVAHEEVSSGKPTDALEEIVSKEHSSIPEVSTDAQNDVSIDQVDTDRKDDGSVVHEEVSSSNLTGSAEDIVSKEHSSIVEASTDAQNDASIDQVDTARQDDRSVPHEEASSSNLTGTLEDIVSKEHSAIAESNRGIDERVESIVALENEHKPIDQVDTDREDDRSVRHKEVFPSNLGDMLENVISSIVESDTDTQNVDSIEEHVDSVVALENEQTLIDQVDIDRVDDGDEKQSSYDAEASDGSSKKFEDVQSAKDPPEIEPSEQKHSGGDDKDSERSNSEEVDSVKEVISPESTGVEYPLVENENGSHSDDLLEERLEHDAFGLKV
ncbi:midasin-like [Topomyia yanbarensis]|uniref:midasin-like n=1 Tax=Topomyia yanbarensis TaxID=2498891 RepID=UPI00273C4A0D|nr:midasin-like [Topomyia yanbarensis]